MLYKLFVIIIFIPVIVFSQQKYSVNGRVGDAETGEWLQGANVTILNTLIGATTDAEGYFEITDLPSGKYKFEFSFIGYSSLKYDIHLDEADTTLIIKLSQTTLSGPMVSVVANQALERVSSVTFNNIRGEELKARYTIQDIPEVISELPSTTFYSENGNGLGYNYLSIRGFDQRRISVMINGIPQNDPEDHNIYWLDFPDFAANTQSIQVQRGAGSGFYGPAAIGGSINLQTNYFNTERQLNAFYGIGSFYTRKYSLSYNTGLLADKFVIYARASRIQSDGYRNRAWVDFWSYFLGAAMYTKNSNLRLHFYGGPIEDGLAYGGLPKLVNNYSSLRRKNYSYWETNAAGDSITYATERRDDEVENFNQPHFELLHEYKINSRITLNNNLFFIHGYGFFDYDGGWVNFYDDPLEYFRLTPEYGYDVESIPWDALIRAYVDNKQFGWLPQLRMDTDWGKLIAGAELRTHRSLHWGRLQKGTGLPDKVAGDGARHYYEYKGAKDIASVYLHLTSEIRPNLFVQSDLQYAWKQYRLYDEKFLNHDFKVPYQFINPRLGLNYNLNKNWNFYTSLSNTTREPRLKNFYDAAEGSTPESWGTVIPQFELNEDGTYNYEKPLVKTESLTGVEIGTGYKTQKIRGTVNFYYMDFHDEIVKQGAVDRFGQPITGNADRTLHQGIEFSGTLHILPQVSLSGNLMLGNNKLISYTVFDDEGDPIELDGNPIAGFPNTLANLRLTYAWQSTYAALDLRYSGKYYTDNFKTETNTVDPYTVLNLIVKQKLDLIGLKGFVLQARVNNLLNKKYLAHGEGTDFFPAATHNGFINLLYEM
jgi:iron complex outermembrane receptor protein